MNTAANMLAESAGMPRQRLCGGESAADGEFSGIFGHVPGSRKSRRLRIQAAREALSRRFPRLRVKSGTMGEGMAGAKNKAEPSDGGDLALVEPSVLAGMFGDSNLTRMVDGAISGFLDRGAGSNLMHIPGAYVRRTVSISITVVRYRETQLSGSTGTAVAGVDLKTNFHNQLKELARKFFAGDEAEPDPADKGVDSGNGADKDKLPWRALGSGTWSLEFFYSSAFMSGFAENTAAACPGAGISRDGDSHGYFAVSGVAAFTGQVLPNALLRGGGSFPQASLNGILGEYGLEAASFRTTRDGVFAGIREHRNLLSELMELYAEKMKIVDGGVAGTDTSGIPAGAGVGAVAS